MPQRPIRTTAKDFPRLLRRRLEEDTRLVERAALDAAARGVHEAVRRTDELGLVDRGQYRMSWKFRRITRGAEIANDVFYAGVLEWGSRPHRVPFAAILGWVQRKLVGNGQVSANAAHAVAIGIQQAIMVRGTKPYGVLRTVSKKLGPWFRDAAVRELRKKARAGR
jgi:hypothetical protein